MILRPARGCLICSSSQERALPLGTPAAAPRRPVTQLASAAVQQSPPTLQPGHRKHADHPAEQKVPAGPQPGSGPARVLRQLNLAQGQPRLVSGNGSRPLSLPQQPALLPQAPSSPAAAPGQNLGTAGLSSIDGSMGPLEYLELLTQPDLDGMKRAKSASDATVLRRKGHLKEQDLLIEFMRNMHQTHACEEVMAKMERWITEHRQDPARSRLRRMVPTVGHYFTPLRLVEAFKEYDEFFSLSRRKFIPPNFAELRHIFNIAQVHASAPELKLATFDADGTLYADGHHMEQDNHMIAHFINLMRSNVHVAIVTAAGYPDAAKFEQRVSGLLQTFQRMNLPDHVVNRFHLMGGECNYLLRVRPGDYRLEFVPEELWKTPEMLSWNEEDIKGLLDEAECILREGAARLNLPVNVLRKARAVGVLPAQATIYEVLEELAITAQTHLLNSKVPYCAFNGGNDVFVDVGNKSLGLQALLRFLGAKPQEVLHVGDRFTQSGNDSATRECCSFLWVASPAETSFFINMLLKDIHKLKYHHPYIE